MAPVRWQVNMRRDTAGECHERSSFDIDIGHRYQSNTVGRSVHANTTMLPRSRWSVSGLCHRYPALSANKIRPARTQPTMEAQTASVATSFVKPSMKPVVKPPIDPPQSAIKRKKPKKSVPIGGGGRKHTKRKKRKSTPPEPTVLPAVLVVDVQSATFAEALRDVQLANARFQSPLNELPLKTFSSD